MLTFRRDNLLVAFVMVLGFVNACGSTDQKARTTMDEQEYPADRVSYEMVGSPEDVSYASVRRFSSRVIVPLGRTREELTATLGRAAHALATERNADAVSVFAYRPGDPTNGIFSAARATLAPHGKWEEAGSGDSLELTVDFSPLYFAPPAAGPGQGDTVELVASYGDDVIISSEYGNWGDEYIKARVKNGTRAVVLERRSQPAGDSEIVRLRVRTLGHHGAHEGWVHGGDAKHD
ncbi:MAG TPA: hypothetical protein VFE05_14800 [Longimicrobiaceae bacterium]|jgi:hypothetical protein|nr:hypothetical protein [Longimicrobiaceae bacterium]